MIAIDWSHTKDLTTYDGSMGGESKLWIKSIIFFQPPIGHIHNAALNRTATFLAKTVYSHIKGNGSDNLLI